MRDELVFISSVMRDYEPVRAAAKAAVTLLGMRPVMAEDFSAKSHSSQNACLDGVRESNIMVLVLGKRYGFIAQSGKSVTQEEYECARDRGMPVLVFLERGDRDAKQSAFVNSLSGYEGGSHHATFSTPEELKDKVVQALTELISGGTKTLDAAGAKLVLDECKWGSRRERDRAPWLAGVIVPARPHTYISLVKLGERAFQRSIQKEAVYGNPAIFDSEHGVKVDETENSTIFIQAGGRGPLATLEVRCDGVLIFGQQLAAGQARTISIVRNFVIDQNEVHEMLANLFKFANGFYGSLDNSRMLTSFYFGGSLSGIENKSFGRIPEVPPSGMSMAIHGFPDPLLIPREPYRLSRSDLVDGGRAATDITEMVARMFRAAKAYYAPERALL